MLVRRPFWKIHWQPLIDCQTHHYVQPRNWLRGRGTKTFFLSQTQALNSQTGVDFSQEISSSKFTGCWPSACAVQFGDPADLWASGPAGCSFARMRQNVKTAEVWCHVSGLNRDYFMCMSTCTVIRLSFRYHTVSCIIGAEQFQSVKLSRWIISCANKNGITMSNDIS